LLIINQHTKATGLKPVVPFSFLGGQYYIFIFFILCSIFFSDPFSFISKGAQAKASYVFIHPDAANADFFGPAAGQGPKNII
jgi:hypothetical protein